MKLLKWLFKYQKSVPFNCVTHTILIAIMDDAVKGSNKVKSSHYDNMPMLYTAILTNLKKNDYFQMKSSDIFFYFSLNIDCGYMLDLPRLGGQNKYSQSTF